MDTEMTVLESFEHIVEAAQNSRLSEQFFESVSAYVGYASGRLSLTPMQTVFLALFVDMCDDSRTSLSELASYTGCRTTRILRFSSEIDILRKKGYVRIFRCQGTAGYLVPYDVLEALKEDRPYVRTDEPVPDLDTFFARFGGLAEQASAQGISHKELLEATEELLDKIKGMRFANKLRDYGLSGTDRLLFVYMAYLYVSDNDDYVGFHDLECLFDDNRIPGIFRLDLTHRHHKLFRDGLIENAFEDGMACTDAFRLTELAKKEMLSEVNLAATIKSRKDLVCSSSISERELIYDTSEREQVNELSSILSAERFAEIQLRLGRAGMRKGFCCLFYGSPGTGKTETVYQIARATGRDIFRVDVSKIKNCWVGESEKNIKEIFTRYRDLCGEQGLAPILLFNEADAVLGTRMEGVTRSVDKMENSIQNIILQEMEELEGIMIATTNLTANLDDAFERRFLYKIQFRRPSPEARARIWRTMIPSLSRDDAGMLASRFDLSGGEIENVSRKYTVRAILSGYESPDLPSIIELCCNERIGGGKIGFGRT